MDSPAYLSSVFGLAGKVAVVIGGTGVLCGAIAEGLAGAGAEVVLVGRDEAKSRPRLDRIRAAGGQASFAHADVTSKSDLQALLASILQASGRVDILINGAGVNSAKPFQDVSEEELEHILSVNLKSVFLACQVFGEYLLARGQGGSVINLGSMSGLVPLSRVFAYSASKAAMHNLSKNLAREWAPKGVRVNILVPGFFPAEQNRSILTPERTRTILGHTPAGRFGEPRELIGAALLLASDAGSFITGSELVVDGGFHAMSV